MVDESLNNVTKYPDDFFYFSFLSFGGNFSTLKIFKDILFFTMFFIVLLQLSHFSPVAFPTPLTPPTPTVNPHPIVHMHGSFTLV